MAADDKAAIEKIQNEMQQRAEQLAARDIEALRSKYDISDGAAQEAMTGAKNSPEGRKVVERFRSQKLNDSTWVKRLLAGDAEAGREFLLSGIALSGDVTEEGT